MNLLLKGIFSSPNKVPGFNAGYKFNGGTPAPRL
jgi:hypothetical protein